MHRIGGRVGDGGLVAGGAEHLESERRVDRNTCRADFGGRSSCQGGEKKGG